MQTPFYPHTATMLEMLTSRLGNDVDIDVLVGNDKYDDMIRFKRGGRMLPYLVQCGVDVENGGPNSTPETRRIAVNHIGGGERGTLRTVGTYWPGQSETAIQEATDAAVSLVLG